MDLGRPIARHTARRPYESVNADRLPDDLLPVDMQTFDTEAAGPRPDESLPVDTQPEEPLPPDPQRSRPTGPPTR